ncbi:MAG TPA: DUF308 domain-containing protein [Solirubrobacteraceae bacterium]|nr:DUF308 domain-containing protein [Solirubrobacteraceae bacterium]
MLGETLSAEELHESTSSWWLFLLAGLIGIAAGVIVLAKPSDSLATLAVIAGIFALLDGGLDLIASFGRHNDNRGLTAVLGVLSVVVGVLLIRHPIGGVLAVALLIGIWLIAGGVVRMVRAFDSDQRAWSIVLALVEVAAGIVIVSSPPIGFATLALLAGISFIVYGAATFALGWLMHTLRRDAQSPAFGAGATA